ncbi:MAG TPA: PRC-barrel domain-containing protein [Micromonosporaceae bacterium]
MRISDLLGRRVYDRDGRPLGEIADLLTRPDQQGRPEVYAAVVAPRRRLRLLGYERTGTSGPWLVERIAGWWHQGTREVAWRDIRLARQPGRSD